MKKLVSFFFFALICNAVQSQINYVEDVNPFIGTGGHGHTYPGATLPHGMVQLSPDTRLEGWDGCSGYHYSDSFIYGF
jgi:putative alpha-1,2-mannosidase